MSGNHLVMLFLQICEIMLEQLSFDLMLNKLQLYSQLFGLWGMLPVIISGKMKKTAYWYCGEFDHHSAICLGVNALILRNQTLKCGILFCPPLMWKRRLNSFAYHLWSEDWARHGTHLHTPFIQANIKPKLGTDVGCSIHRSKGCLLLIRVTNIYSRQGCLLQDV